MTPPFPNSPAPSYYRHARWTTAADKRNALHYVGETVAVTLTAALADDVTYEVRDYFGNIVSTGGVSAGQTSIQPTAPTGGWKPGWYRLYLIGDTYDANFAYSCGCTNFCVVRDDPHFPPMPPGNTPGGVAGEYNDPVGKGVFGIGTSRLVIANAATHTDLADWEAEAELTMDYWVNPGAPYADAARPRYAWCTFPNGGVDTVQLGSTVFGWVFCKDETVDGSKVFVEVVDGTTPGTGKLNVYYPNATTLVETYDNIDRSAGRDALVAAVASSAYIYFGSYNGTLENLAKQAIGRAMFDGVSACVAALYAKGVTHFEGPVNEPPMSGVTTSMWPVAMRLFQAAVHAGHPSAKAIGPSFVTIEEIPANQGWDGFFINGGDDYCDELSFHAYNAIVNGDLNLGRSSLTTFSDLLDSYSVSKTMWQTESTSAMTTVYGAYHPRRSRVPILQTLLFEQYGVAKERNNYWYDTSHGFWSVPVWWQNNDGGPQPHAVLYRVLAEEIWGKPYASALEFGTVGNAMYLGNVYTAGDGSSVIALMATSYMVGASVALTISGTSAPLTVVDGLGNERAMPLSKGRITLPMTDLPTYVRLPSGASATVYRINGHSPLGIGASSTPDSTTKQIDGVTYSVIADDAYMTSYADGTGIAPTTYATPPSNATALWSGDRTIERVMVWCGPAWQSSGTLVDFDVQTYDGATWTTRKTVTKDGPPYFYFGTDSVVEGCFVETFWDEQWIFDVEFDSAVSCRGVRLNVREASYGGEPLANDGGAFGQGTSVQAYRIQEIAATDVNRYTAVGA